MCPRRADSSSYTEIRLYTGLKAAEATGLDIRTFEDAMTFKIAMMVVNYMKYLDTLEY